MKPPASITNGLSDELIQCIEPCPVMGWQIRHPLLIENFLGENVNPRWVKTFEVRKEYVERLLKGGEFGKAIFMFMRPFRFQKYLDLVFNKADLETQAKLLLDTWVDSEKPHVNRDYWNECFSKLAHEPLICDTLDSIQFPLTLYRGFSAEEGEDLTDVAMSLSWSTSLDVATKFATRDHRPNAVSYIASVTVTDRGLLYAYTDDRDEKEVITNIDIIDEDVKIEEI